MFAVRSPKNNSQVSRSLLYAALFCEDVKLSLADFSVFVGLCVVFLQRLVG